MPKEVFKRNKNHKNIGEIPVTVQGNPEERIKKMLHSGIPASKNWPLYEQLDTRPETK
jgi:hypothetical protein